MWTSCSNKQPHISVTLHDTSGSLSRPCEIQSRCFGLNSFPKEFFSMLPQRLKLLPAPERNFNVVPPLTSPGKGDKRGNDKWRFLQANSQHRQGQQEIGRKHRRQRKQVWKTERGLFHQMDQVSVYLLVCLSFPVILRPKTAQAKKQDSTGGS